jgi:histidyl-tRNA synthetase
MTGRKLEKQIKTAVKKGIELRHIHRRAELADDRYKLKNLTNGEEETHGRDRIIAMLRDRRRKHTAPASEPVDEDDFDI